MFGWQPHFDEEFWKSCRQLLRFKITIKNHLQKEISNQFHEITKLISNLDFESNDFKMVPIPKKSVFVFQIFHQILIKKYLLILQNFDQKVSFNSAKFWKSLKRKNTQFRGPNLA